MSAAGRVSIAALNETGPALIHRWTPIWSGPRKLKPSRRVARISIIGSNHAPLRHMTQAKIPPTSHATRLRAQTPVGTPVRAQTAAPARTAARLSPPSMTSSDAGRGVIVTIKITRRLTRRQFCGISECPQRANRRQCNGRLGASERRDARKTEKYVRWLDLSLPLMSLSCLPFGNMTGGAHTAVAIAWRLILPPGRALMRTA